ncbi:MAG TPA: sulfatase-like hydrolase/transferase, partial [Pirellulales bacterium]|nr:sulfatase-like hydrolase/transferase [Pirellulales bacterium]
MACRGLLVALLLAVAVASTSGLARAAERPPNFVIIFIDDMGYADIGPFGAEGYETPHLNRMAREGRRFTDFYVTQAVCSASRAGLMTGCYNVRVGIQGWLRAASDHGIHADEMTLAEVVKQQGYASACYGKWHLGHHPKFLPTSQGFDEFFGIPWSNNMRPLPFMEGTRVSKPTLTEADRNNFTALCTQRAVRFIESNKSRPFLLYLPHAMV